MNHYRDFWLLPDPEFVAPVLMNALYIKLHKKLHDMKATSIGVSFPKAKGCLGDVLRLHGDKAGIELVSNNWLGGLAGYCNVGEIQQIPEGVKHRTVSRWQHNMSEAQLRRLIKRAEAKGEPMSGAKVNAYRESMRLQQETSRPYINLQSGSNGHKHRRYIQFGELQDQPVEGEFDTFGLSKTATVPWF